MHASSSPILCKHLFHFDINNGGATHLHMNAHHASCAGPAERRSPHELNKSSLLFGYIVRGAVWCVLYMPRGDIINITWREINQKHCVRARGTCEYIETNNCARHLMRKNLCGDGKYKNWFQYVYLNLLIRQEIWFITICFLNNVYTHFNATSFAKFTHLILINDMCFYYLKHIRNPSQAANANATFSPCIALCALKSTTTAYNSNRARALTQPLYFKIKQITSARAPTSACKFIA